MTNKHKLWCEKYRPHSLDDYIFYDEDLKKATNRFIKDKSIPHLLFSGVQGSGKAQPLYSKILTPDGWRTMGDMKIGDKIITPSNHIASVIDIFPQGEKDIYTITFHDGSSTECCLDHLWKCYFPIKGTRNTSVEQIVDTRTIINFLNKDKNRKLNVSIPLISEIELNNIDGNNLSIDPYLLGVLIGDGSFCYTNIRISSNDEQIIEECESVLPDGYRIKRVKNTIIEYILVNENRKNFGGRIGLEENKIMKYLRGFGLQGKRSHEKFIPEEYKNSSISDRWKLVQGLMDTDGTIGKTGNVSFTTTSHKLAYDLQNILWSLGCTCTMSSRTPTYKYKGEKKKGKLSFTLFMNHNNGTKQFFKLNRKRDRGIDTFAENHSKGNIELRRRVLSIEYKGKEEAKCILIDDQDHLYITDDFVVTHNTTLAFILINEMDLDETDVLTLNASDENSVDVMRDKIKSFVSTHSFGDFKIVHLEEADYITPNGQAVMRRLMEDYADFARFILTCNYDNKIIPAVKSRCQHFHFRKPDFDEVLEYIYKILKKEKVRTDFETLEKYVSAGYPDIRKIINLVQQNTHNGLLVQSSSGSDDDDWKLTLLDMIGRDEWMEARNMCAKNVSDGEWEEVYRLLYENLARCGKFKDDKKWEEGIVVIAEHLYKHALVAIPSINGVAMFIGLAQI